jgi:hypothetical protein
MSGARPFEEWPIEETIALFSETAHASDRVAAIACAAFLDGVLLTALAARFIHMGKRWEDRIFSGATAPLSSFSAKMRLGYALALYGPITYRDLDIIRSIRNGFAHTAAPVTFEHPIIAEQCHRLIESQSHVIFTGSATLPFTHGSPKGLYIGATQHIAMSLIHQEPRPERPTRSVGLP